MIGQMQYYSAAGYGGAGMGAQAAASPALSHMSHQASGAYPSSPGHSVGYGMQSGQPVRTIRVFFLFFCFNIFDHGEVCKTTLAVESDYFYYYFFLSFFFFRNVRSVFFALLRVDEENTWRSRLLVAGSTGFRS